MAFDEKEIKEWIRNDCLRESSGKPRTKPERLLRVLGLWIEGTSDGPPVWHHEFLDEEDALEENVDVDGIVAKIRRAVDREVGQKKSTVMFRLQAVHGMMNTVSPTSITAQLPFTVHPTKRIRPDPGEEANGYQQSFEEGNEKGANAWQMRGMKIMQEIHLQGIADVIQEKDQTISDLRSQLGVANERIHELEGKLDEAEDKRLERAIKMRDAALKQRLKEKGGRLVMNAVTMIMSSYMADKTGPKQVGPAAAPPQMGSGAPPPPNDGPSSGDSGGGSSGGAPAPNAQPGAPAQAAPQTQVDPVAEAIVKAKSGQPFNVDAVFGAFVEEVMPHVSQLAMTPGIVTQDQQAMLFQMFQIYSNHGRADRMLLRQFAEDLGEGGDSAGFHRLMNALPSVRAKQAFAVILSSCLTEHENEKREDHELENDLNTRVDRSTSGEMEGMEPIVPEDNVSDIEVPNPKMLTRKEAEEKRKKRAEGVKVKQSTPDKGKRPL